MGTFSGLCLLTVGVALLPGAVPATGAPVCAPEALPATVNGGMSWYNPPSYGVTWATVIANFESWGRLHGIVYDPTHPYCAMRDYPVGSLVEITWHGATARCLVVDYGPDAAIYPERVIDGAVEVFRQLHDPEFGVLRNVTVTLVNTDHCGRAPAATATAPRVESRWGWHGAAWRYDVRQMPLPY